MATKTQPYNLLRCNLARVIWGYTSMGHMGLRRSHGVSSGQFPAWLEASFSLSDPLLRAHPFFTAHPLISGWG